VAYSINQLSKFWQENTRVMRLIFFFHVHTSSLFFAVLWFWQKGFTKYIIPTWYVNVPEQSYKQWHVHRLPRHGYLEAKARMRLWPQPELLYNNPFFSTLQNYANKPNFACFSNILIYTHTLSNWITLLVKCHEVCQTRSAQNRILINVRWW